MLLIKSKKAIIIFIVFLITIIISSSIIIFIVKEHGQKSIKIPNKLNETKIKMPNMFTISYLIGHNCLNPLSLSYATNITINQDGNVRIKIDKLYEGVANLSIEPIEYKVDKGKSFKLMSYFYEQKFYELKKDLSVKNAYDFSNSYLEVKSNTFNRKVGGYAAELNEEFNKFVEKFYTIIDDNIFQKFWLNFHQNFL